VEGGVALHEDPFEVLGIEPTLDVAAIRRAYFRAVTAHPPHADAKAFRRVRDAYERLATPAAAAAAFLAAPIDAPAALSPLRRRFDEALARAIVAVREARGAQGATRRLATEISRASWEAAVRSFK
jgi:hypothetical protein